MSTPWIDVNMPWRISRSPEAEKLGQEFIAAVNAAKEIWRKNNPESFQLHAGGDLADEAIELQDHYPWVKGVLDAPSPEAYRDEAMRRLPEAAPDHQPALKALILHRYFYRLESNFIDKHPDVVRTSAACQARRELERTLEFCHHPMCKVGVQIQVVGQDGQRTLLIGDTTASGNEDGCCSAGLRDDDIVLRYRDFSYLLKYVEEQNV